MRLYAAIVPPEPVRAEIADLVRSVAPWTPELDPVPVPEMRIPVTNFGNVTLSDGITLVETLREAATKWTCPRLTFTGSAALEFEGDRSVWAKLDGDLDDLLEVGRGVPKVVQPLGFLVDRRKFRPWLSVGTITEATSLPYLEKLTAALEGFSGMPWTLESLTVFRKVPVDAAGVDEAVHEQVPLRAA
jgi:2'-5' RNA ligase